MDDGVISAAEVMEAMRTPDAREAIRYIAQFLDGHRPDEDGWAVVTHALHFHGLYHMEDACFAALHSNMAPMVRSVALAVRSGEIPRLSTI